MKKYEYKTIELDLKGLGLFGPKKVDGEFESILNSEGQNGWKYVDTLLVTGAYGEASKIKLIFEKEIENG